jgi:hypothetical protein
VALRKIEPINAELIPLLPLFLQVALATVFETMSARREDLRIRSLAAAAATGQQQ